MRELYVTGLRTVSVALILAVSISVVRANYVLSMDWGWMH